MRDFKDITAFLAYMEGANARMADAGLIGLTSAAKAIEIEARTEIGEYQEGAGNFVSWPELADSTKDQRVKLGYSENDPGLRSGEMRDSIESGATFNRAAVGSDSEKLLWFDQGTKTQPPRSVFGIASIRKTDSVVDVVAGSVAHALAGVALPKIR